MSESWRCLLCGGEETGGLSSWLTHYREHHGNRTLRVCSTRADTRCDCGTGCGLDSW